MIEILEAIALKVSSTPALTSGLAGGFHLNHPGEGTTMPFAVLTPISAPLQYNTSRTYLQPVSMQLSIFAATVGEIATLIKAYRDAFNRQALTLASGKVIAAVLTDERLVDDVEDENDALHSKHYVLEFEFTQLQTHV
jgi:hypothetical protein